jgi:hypothetical protein
MNFADYIAGIKFRFIKPHTPLIPLGFDRITQRLRLGVFLEILNTRLARRERETKRTLRSICNIPKMSTFAIGAIICEGVAQMPDKYAFVNVGVWHGFTFLSGMAGNGQKKCIGIDNFSEFGGPQEAFLERFDAHRDPNHRFYEMDYREYFSKVHREPIGFYVYDGNHSYSNQLMGLEAAEPFFSQGSVILIDDANYSHVRKATLDFIDKSPHEYDLLLDQKTFCNNHPTFWNGVMVLQRAG